MGKHITLYSKNTTLKIICVNFEKPDGLGFFNAMLDSAILYVARSSVSIIIQKKRNSIKNICKEDTR